MSPADDVRAALARLAARPVVEPAESAESADDTRPMTKTDVVEFLDSFAQARRDQGDTVVAASTPGYYLYETGLARTGIAVWGDDEDWTFSAFSAAAVRVRPTLELYRRVGVWRSTVPECGCYVIEDGSDAAVLCERTVRSLQVFQGPTTWRLLRTIIDLVGDFAVLLGRDLAPHGGTPFTLRGETGLVLLLGWWEIQDPQIVRNVRGNG